MLKTEKFVKVTKKINFIAEHPADDKFIECAQAAANYIVSGEKHLLEAVRYKKTQIVLVRVSSSHGKQKIINAKQKIIAFWSILQGFLLPDPRELFVP